MLFFSGEEQTEPLGSSVPVAWSCEMKPTSIEIGWGLTTRKYFCF